MMTPTPRDDVVAAIPSDGEQRMNCAVVFVCSSTPGDKVPRHTPLMCRKNGDGSASDLLPVGLDRGETIFLLTPKRGFTAIPQRRVSGVSCTVPRHLRAQLFSSLDMSDQHYVDTCHMLDHAHFGDQ